MDLRSYTVLQECCQTFSSGYSGNWIKEEKTMRKEIDPIESLRLLTEHTSVFNHTIEHNFLRVPDKEAQRDGKRIVKCHCGETAMAFRLCPAHYYQAFWDLEQPYLQIRKVLMPKASKYLEYPKMNFADISLVEGEDGQD